MKRSAAIIGPTPQFVRWAIAQPCSLRELDLDNLPESTFRQLRGIRALSEGMAERRVFEQICVHPSVSSVADAPSARGFQITEIIDLAGGQHHLDRCCHSCPANATANTSLPWAGCYGWLPADVSWSLNQADCGPAEKQRLKPEEDLPPILESVIQGRLKNQFEREYGNGKPWYALWQHRVLEPGQLRILKSALDLALELTNHAAPVRHLLDATGRCLRFGRELHVELVPPGFSNGSTWVICEHCPDCKCTVQTENICEGCQRVGKLAAERKYKVLGYRPYLLLGQVLGETAAAQFVGRYVAFKNMEQSSV